MVALSVVTFSLPLASVDAAQAPPQIFTYQGRLADSGGNLLGGTGTPFFFKFSIWTTSAIGTGTRLWPSSVPATTTATVRQGVFTVNIGDTANGYPDPLDLNFSSNVPLYLQVEVSSNNISSETLSPRQQLTSAAFAQVSGAVVGTTTPSVFGTTTPALNSFVTIAATSSNSIPLSIVGVFNQIANLFQIQNSFGTNLFSVDAAGGLNAVAATTTSFFATTASSTNLFTTGLTATAATTTSLAVTGNATTTINGGLAVSGSGLKISNGGLVLGGFNCAGFGSGGKLTTDANGNVFCANDQTTAGGSGITEIGPFGQLQNGTTQTFSTTTSSFNGLTVGNTITAAPGSNIINWQPTLLGTLNVAGGGTGLTSINDGQLLFGSGGTTLSTLATSTGGFLTNSFSTGRPSWAATSTIFGTGTGGQVLAWNNGVPTFTATTTFSTGLLYANGNVTNTGVLSIGPTGQPITGAVVIATSSTPFNGLTSSTTVTSSGQNLTFTNSLAGLLGVGGGGTGSTTLSGILVGNATNPIKTLLIGTGLTFDGSTLASSAATNFWTLNGNNIYNNNNAGTGFVGVGTSTPWANLSVASANATALGALFAVASSSANVATSTLFVINGNGNVGIGTSSPIANLHLVASLNRPNLLIELPATTSLPDPNYTYGPQIQWQGGEEKFGKWRQYINAAEYDWALIYNSALDPYTTYPPVHAGRDSGNVLANIVAQMRFDVAEGNSGQNFYEVAFAPPGDVGTIPVWNSGASMHMFDGGLLEVKNPGPFKEAAIQLVSNNFFTRRAFDMRVTANGIFKIEDGTVNTNTLVADSDAIDRLVIDTNGFVGIGNSAPTSFLSVSNNLNTPANTPLFTVASTTGGISTSTMMTILANGNVGIGSSAPTSFLSVINNLNTPANTPLFTVASTTGGISTSTFMTILSNGNVGFGTANPGGLFGNSHSVNIVNDLGAAELRLQSTAGPVIVEFDANTGSDWHIQNSGGNFTFTETGVGDRLTLLAGGNVGVGVGSPGFKLDVAGFINTDKFSGYKQDGNTVLYASTTNQSLAVGASGAAAWMSATSSAFLSVAVGAGALATAPTSGLAIFNSAFGVNALTVNTTGFQNSAFGKDALVTNDSGNNNSAFGYLAAATNQGGNNNVAIGSSALTANDFGSANVVVGTEAASNGTMSSTTALGYRAGFSLNGGGMNTFVGYQSGRDVTTGSNNITLGSNVNAPLATGNQQLNIGNILYGKGVYNGAAASSVPTAAGAVGIGTTTPSARLDVAGTLGSLSDLFNVSSTTATNIVSSLFRIQANGNVGIATSTPWGRLSVAMDTTNPAFVVSNFGSTSPSLYIGGVNQNGFVGFGTTTTPSLARIIVDGTMSANGSGSAIAGIHEILTFNPTTANTVQVGNRLVVLNSPSGSNATNTAIAQIVRIVDNSNISNLARGVDITASGGNNTFGVNTGLRAIGHTFGVQGITTGLAGGTSTPAALYGESDGTTQGDALRLFTSTLTSAPQMAQFFQNSSAFTGAGLLMNFAAGSGSFTGNFLDLQQNSISQFRVSAFGTTTIGQSGQTTNAAGLLIPYGSICVDNDGSCTGTTTGAVAAVQFLTGHTNDVAEYYYSNDMLETGDIVSTKGGAAVAKASAADAGIVGAVSTKPGLELGTELPVPDGASRYPIGLAGRIPVKVSTESGTIHTGDEIALSDIAGVGMKYSSTTDGTVVGIALENFDGTANYLSDGVVDTESTQVATGTPVCTQTLVHNDNKAGGGANIEGGSPSVTAPGDTYVENCTQDKVLAKPQNQPALVDSANGHSVKKGKILMLISLSRKTASIAGTMFSTDPNGKWYIDQDGNVQAESIIAKTIVVKNALEVGTAAAPIGMTLYDTNTKQPYCLYITDGAVRTVPGKCSATGSTQSSPSTPAPTAVPETPTSLISTPPSESSTTPPVDTNSSTTTGVSVPVPAPSPDTTTVPPAPDATTVAQPAPADTIPPPADPVPPPAAVIDTVSAPTP